MTKFVIYKKPRVEDKHYNEYDWTQYQTPFSNEDAARGSMPKIGSEVAEGYNYRIVEFSDDEDIPSLLTDAELRKHT